VDPLDRSIPRQERYRIVGEALTVVLRDLDEPDDTWGTALRVCLALSSVEQSYVSSVILKRETWRLEAESYPSRMRDGRPCRRWRWYPTHLAPYG
jgi:hypothetical protein